MAGYRPTLSVHGASTRWVYRQKGPWESSMGSLGSREGYMRFVLCWHGGARKGNGSSGTQPDPTGLVGQRRSAWICLSLCSLTFNVCSLLCSRLLAYIAL